MFSIFEKALGRHRHPLETRQIRINGMTAKSCERTIRKALLTKNGVRNVYINRHEGLATVSFDPTQINLAELSNVILRKGYSPGGEVTE